MSIEKEISKSIEDALMKSPIVISPTLKQSEIKAFLRKNKTIFTRCIVT